MENDDLYKPPKSNLKDINPDEYLKKRPIALTVACLVGFLGAPVVILAIYSENQKQ